MEEVEPWKPRACVPACPCRVQHLCSRGVPPITTLCRYRLEGGARPGDTGSGTADGAPSGGGHSFLRSGGKEALVRKEIG